MVLRTPTFPIWIMNHCANFPNLSNDIASLSSLLYYNNENGCSYLPGKKGRSAMSKDELTQKIIEMLNACNDIPLIHLIYKLLVKSL